MRDIQHHLASTLGTDLSHETISKITDQISQEVLAWQHRPLDGLYPVIYLDAIMIKVRDGAHVTNKAAHIAVGVDMDGIKHVLGIWVQASEGARFWAQVCAELANRGIKDVLIVEGAPPARERSARGNVTGLPAFPRRTQAVLGPRPRSPPVWSTRFRAPMRFVSYGESRKVAAALKADLHRPEPGGRLAGSDRLLRVRHGGQVPPDGGDLGAGLGAIHSLPGLPSDAQACHLSPTSWEVPPPPTRSRLRATSCARFPRTAATSPPMRR